MESLARVWSTCLSFVIRDFRETLSYRLAFFMQFYGIFFSVTLFYFIARVFSSAAAPSLGPYGSDYFSFVLVGLAFMGFMQSGMTVFAGSIRQGQVTGTLEAMLVTPTSLSFIVTASALWTFLRGTLNVAVFLAVGVAFGVDLSKANWLVATLILLLTISAFSGLGILSAAFVLAFKKGDPVSVVFGALTSLLSGAYFPVSLLPWWLQECSRFIPLSHALEGMRRALLTGEGFVDLRPQIGALTLFTLLFLPAGLVGFRAAVRHAKREGTLAHY